MKPTTPPLTDHFADRLVLRQRRLGHPLCVGLDPHLDRIPRLFRRGTMDPGDPETAASVEDFLFAVLDQLPGKVAVVKPQIAFFEALGWRGLRVLERVVERARHHELLVLLDAKRGDIGSSAAAYARAYLVSGAPLPVDAVTLNPYLGRDTLEPFVTMCEGGQRGLFVLVKTSNPGSGDYQDRSLTDGGSLWQAVASSLEEMAGALAGPETGWSSLGIVAGATWPGEAERIRALLPRALFLIPGYGAQGAGAKEAVRGLVQGPDGRLEGGLVNSSRGILFPDGSGDDDATAWERSIEETLKRSTSELAEAIGG